jgi:Na+-transporting methylmalonyl-CoA/oxaloacetate decarboxylase gamma subunit
MSKKPVDFMSAMQTFEDREGVQRRPKPALVPPAAEAPSATPAAAPVRQVQRSRVGKVSIGVWVDPAVRKQLAQIALDNDVDQADLIAEGLNLMFERYGKPPIA